MKTNDRGQYGKIDKQIADKPSGITGASAIAIGIGAILLVPVVAIVGGSAMTLALTGKR